MAIFQKEIIGGLFIVGLMMMEINILSLYIIIQHTQAHLFRLAGGHWLALSEAKR